MDAEQPGRLSRLLSSAHSAVSAVAASLSPSKDVTTPADAIAVATAATTTATTIASKSLFSCDWDECVVNAPPSKCQREGCNVDVHHLCQNEWQSKHNYIEESCSWYCRAHNKFYQAYISGKGDNDAVDFTGGDGLRLDSDDDGSTPPMPPLPDPNNSPMQQLSESDNIQAEKMTIGRPTKKARAPTTVITTARKGKKRQARCVVGSRVSITRKLLKTHIDFESDAFSSIEGLSDDLLLYGTVIESKLRGSFVVRFELLPTNNQLITVTRSHLTTVDKNAEEPEYGHVKSVEATTEINGSDEEWEDETEEAVSKKPTRKKNPWIESQEDFLSLPDDVRASSKTFEHFYGTKPDEKLYGRF